MVSINKTRFSFNIPDDYITNIDTRMNMYRKISITEKSELDEIVVD